MKNLLPLLFLCIFAPAVFAIDTDGDGVDDSVDNCTAVANTLQRDTDADGYGNFCDADFDNNLAVNTSDLYYLKAFYFTSDPHADLNGDGTVSAADLFIFKSLWLQPPGPSCCGE